MNADDPVSTVSLYLHGDQLDPDLVTEHLGTMPTTARRKGGARSLTRDGADESFVQSTGVWALELTAEGSVSASIDKLCARLGNRSCEPGEIEGVEESVVDIVAIIPADRQDEEPPGFQLSRQDIASLQALRVPFRCTTDFLPGEPMATPNTAPVITHCCAAMTQAVEQEEMPVSYWHAFREYGFRLSGESDSVAVIGHCPWCGTRLPESLRERWHVELERRGIDPTTNDLPDDFRNDTWHEG